MASDVGDYEDQEVEADSDFGTTSSSLTKRKRKRKPVTCGRCRTRKLKCDRNAPCGACKEKGVQCVWDGAVRVAPATTTREEEAVELRSQLSRLENIIGILSASRGRDEESSLLSEDESGGQSGSRRHDSERESAAQALESLSASSSNGAIPRPYLLALSHPSSPDDILKLLPSKSDLDIYISEFFSQELTFLPILYGPSFIERYNIFTPKAAQRDMSFASLLTAIAGWVLYRNKGNAGMQSQPVSLHSATVDRTHMESAMTMLHLSAFMDNPTVDAVRTLAIIAEWHTQQESPAARHILTTAITIAQDLGLNMEPDIDSRDPLLLTQQEERRHLWTHLVTTDWLSSCGRTSSCSAAQCNTLTPTSSLDGGQVPAAVAPILSLPLLKIPIATIARIITDRAYSAQIPPSWVTIFELNADLARLDASLPPNLAFEWLAGSVKPLDKETNLLDTLRVNIHLAIRKQFIRLHRPFLTRGFADERFAFSREKCCWAARYILAIHRGLGDDYRATQNWDLTNNTLNALIILAIDLYQDPRGPYSAIHSADINASVQILEKRSTKLASVSETLRVISVLLNRLDRPGGYTHLGKDGLPQTLSNSQPHANRSNTTNQFFDPAVPFRRLLPTPMTFDSGYMQNKVYPDHELKDLWNTLRKNRSMFSLPDKAEWEEILRAGRHSAAWEQGVDLLS